MDGLYIFELNLVFLIYENNRLYFWLFSSFIFIRGEQPIAIGPFK